MKDYCFYRDTIVESVKALPNARVFFATSRQETQSDCSELQNDKVKQMKGYAQDWLLEKVTLDYIK